jgi:hypothetical protein
MAIHITNPRADAAVRELPRRWAAAIADVVRIATINTLKRDPIDRVRASRKARAMTKAGRQS